MLFQALKIENQNEKKYLIAISVKKLKEMGIVKKGIKNEILILKDNEDVFFSTPLELKIFNNYEEFYGLLEIVNIKEIEIYTNEDISLLKDEHILSFVVKKGV